MKIEDLLEFVMELSENAKLELQERWDKWEKDFAINEVHEVIGGLLARQVSIFTSFCESPTMWNWHLAPTILRTMIDTHITIAWILSDPLIRSEKYIYYGLGQVKLEIEHRKKQVEQDGINPEDDELTKANERWLNSQRWSFLTEVNVGSWSGLTTRKMAEEAGILDFYNYCYVPFSSGAHSQWHHISIHNLIPCERPLHRYHKIPTVDRGHSQIQPFELAAKYMWKSFDVFDSKYNISIKTKSTYDMLINWLYKGNNSEDQSNN